MILTYQCYSMIPSTTYFKNKFTVQTFNSSWELLVFQVIMPQLPMSSFSSTKEFPSLIKKKSMVTSCTDLHDLHFLLELYRLWYKLVILFTNSKLPISPIAPTEDIPINTNRNSVVSPTCKLADLSFTKKPHWFRCIDIIFSSVSKLPKIITLTSTSPGIQYSFLSKGNRVEITTPYFYHYLLER